MPFFHPLRLDALCIVLFCALLALVIPASPAWSASRAEMWKKVEKAINDGLPKTAVEELTPIVTSALQDKAYGEAAKAMCRRIVLEANVQGNKPEEKVTRLQTTIETAPTELKPLLNAVLARWYWHYFRQNNWRFMNRTATAKLDEKDFTTWDLPKLFGHIGGLFDAALSEKATLKALPIEEFNDFLQAGNMPREYRPTLYDFLAFQALEFYTSGEQAGARPQDSFDIEVSSPALADASGFMAWNPATTDTDSSKYKAIRLLQELMKFHAKDKDRGAFLDADLFRLRWLKSIAVGEGAGELCFKQLDMIAREFADHALSSTALEAMARIRLDEGKKKEAHALASDGAKRFPSSPGGQNCRSLISSIEARTFEVLTERVAGNPLPRIKIDYTNIERVHFRLVKADWHTQLKQERWSQPEDIRWNEWEKLLSYSPAKEWSVDLPATPDYLTRTEMIPFPEMRKGFYYLVASWKDSFTRDGNALRMTTVFVSDLALMTRNRWGTMEAILVDNGSGDVVKDATVQVYRQNNEGWWREKGTLKPNSDGWYKVTGENSFLLTGTKGDDFIAMPQPQNTWQPSEEPQQTSVFFFTDRAIYRPGQMIQFKGLLVHVDKAQNRYEVRPNQNVDVIFYDVNHQQILRQTFTTNDAGSFSGTFTAPTDRLPGMMQIVANTFGGAANFRVEEYKRPKFKVTLDVPSEGGKLGEKLVVKGNAMAFTGAAIDGARVKYRVVREVVMPWWCWWRVVRTPTQEITHGTVTTDVQGKFEIPFVPAPDRSIPEADQPVFTFRVMADVTDSTGETRSGQQSVRLGYTALDLGLQAEQWIEAGKEFRVNLSSQTLDGKGVPANGTLQVHSLKAPAKVMRKAFFDQEDAGAADYRRWEAEKVVNETPFSTSVDGNASTALTLPAGAYRLTASARDRFGKTVKTQFDLLVSDPSATKFPIRIPHALVTKSTSLEPGETFRALWGTGYDKGRAYIEVEQRHKMLKSYWTPADFTQHEIEMPVDESLRGGFTVHVTYFRENRSYTEKVPVYVPWTNKQLSLKFARFRDKLQPGQKETWSLLIKGPGAEMKAVEMAAALYDESLEAFAKHSIPSLNFFYQDSSDAHTQFANMPKHLNSMVNDWNSIYGQYSISYPQFPSDIIINFHGYDYYDEEMAKDGAPGGGGRMLRKSMAPPAPSAMPAAAPREEKSRAKSLSANFADSEEATGMPQGVAATTPTTGSAAPADQIDLSKVSARTNLNETAFFFPHLAVEKDGSVTINFTMPEALTSWKFLGLAHGMKGESGTITNTTVTQKDLMVQPNPPRFLREGDVLGYTAKVTNMTDKVQKGKIKLSLRDAGTDKPRDADFGLTAPELEFEVPAKESRSYAWTLKVPDGTGIIVHKVVAASSDLSDGEEAMLPVLSKRIFVIESLPLPIRGPATKEFQFKKLIESGKSDTLKHQALTLQVTSNPAWYAVQALPYLMEFPHECSEQTFNRVYANSLARRIALSDPKIKKVFETWKAMEAQGGTALKSNLEKNESLKNSLLIETPWVLDAQSETERKHRVGLLFDSNRVDSELKRGIGKLRQMQFNDGAWPWFPGGRPNSFITLYITTGFGRLRHLGVDLEMDLALKAVGHLDEWIRDVYENLKRHGWLNQVNIGYDTALYLYGRSFFLKERAIPAQSKEAVDYFLGQAEKYWLKLNSRMSQAHAALGLFRFGKKEIPAKIVASLKERSVNDEELGQFWRDTEESWWWYRAPIETQALMIEVFDEIAQDAKAVEDCKVWLIKQKQTQDWKTSKATADAIYGLLLKGVDMLASDKLVRVALGGKDVQPPATVEAGTGYYEVKYAPEAIKADMGKITMKKEDQGVAWGALHWQYFEEMSKVTPHTTNLKLKKALFVKEDTAKGPQITPVTGKIKVGDLLTVRVELRTDRDMEYVHLKDGRGSGLEPTETISQYRTQDGLMYYQATRDTASHFYIDYLPKGTYVFEYTLRVQHKGRYQTGMAEIQCMYAPEFNSHSESFVLDVE